MPTIYQINTPDEVWAALTPAALAAHDQAMRDSGWPAHFKTPVTRYPAQRVGDDYALEVECPQELFDHLVEAQPVSWRCLVRTAAYRGFDLVNDESAPGARPLRTWNYRFERRAE